MQRDTKAALNTIMAFDKTLALGLAHTSITTAVVAPDLTHKVGATIVDKGSEYYNFKQHSLSSVGQKRHYKVTIALPEKPSPGLSYPALYMLDGNAALAGLNEQGLSPLRMTLKSILTSAHRHTTTHHRYDTSEEIKKHASLNLVSKQKASFCDQNGKISIWSALQELNLRPIP